MINCAIYQSIMIIIRYICEKITTMVYANNGLENPITGEYEAGMDSLSGHEHKHFSNDGFYRKLMQKAAHYYDDMSPLRKKWTRANNYYMGRQLDDEVIYNGRKVKVKDLLKLRGLPEFQNDIISDKVLTLKGLMRQENMSCTCKSTDADEDMFAAIFSELLKQNDTLNERSQLNSELFEKFLIYAFLCVKVNHDYRQGRDDIYLEQKDIYKLALPPFEKSDLSDIKFIAEAHDMEWSDILRIFCKDENGNASRKAEEELKQIYKAETDRIQSLRHTGFNNANDSDDFYHSSTIGKYRVVEIWTLERNRALWCHDRATADVGYRPLSERDAIEAENERRKHDNVMRDENGLPILDAEGNEMYYVDPDHLQLIEYRIDIEEFWYYRFLSPNGYLLKEGCSPYKVTRDGYSFYYQPYAFLAYPCLQGEIRSFIDRCEDKQNATNHYMLMLDSLLGHAMKGVAIDSKSVTPLQGLDEMIANATKPNGVVIYNSEKGEAPKPLAQNHLPQGLDWMINQNQSIVVSQSGVQGALQGVHRNTSGKQYQMERESAATTVADYFGAFYSFQKRVCKIQLWQIQQFYDSHRSVKVSGEDFKQYYNPETMMDVNFDLTLDMDANSAVMRETNNDMLWQLMLNNKIDLPTMLDCGYWTNTARLKKRYEEYQQRMLEQTAQTGVMPQAATGGATHLQQGRGDGPQPVIGGVN